MREALARLEALDFQSPIRVFGVATAAMWLRHHELET